MNTLTEDKNKPASDSKPASGGTPFKKRAVRSEEDFIMGAQVGAVPTETQNEEKPKEVKEKRSRKRKKRDIFVSHTIPLTEEEYQRLERVSAKLGQLHNGTIRYALIQLEKMLED